MHDAVDWKISDENPFFKVKTQKSSVKVNEFAPREVVDKLMKKANPGLASDLGVESLRWASDAFGNVVASLGGQGLEKHTSFRKEGPFFGNRLFSSEGTEESG